MNLRTRIAHWIAPAETRAIMTQTSLALVEALGGEKTASGQRPTPANVEGLATATSCVNVISSTAASLPVYTYERVGRGREERPDHPVARMLAEPNPNAPWPVLLEWAAASILLRGNALFRVERDEAGEAAALYPILWDHVAPVMLGNGRLAYDVTELDPAAGTFTLRRRLLDHEALHLRDRTDDGLIGRSRISRAAETFGASLALQEWNSSMWQNGVTPSGAVTLAGASLEATARVREALKQSFTGPANARKVLVLPDGATWSSLSVSPEDAEVLASRRFSTEEVARIFGVPPPLVGIWDHSSFTNSETAGRWFATFTLAPLLRKIEAEFQRSIFAGRDRRTHHVEFDLSALTRGDYAARWAAHAIAVSNDILDRNEVREIEGWNPRAVRAPETKEPVAP